MMKYEFERYSLYSGDCLNILPWVKERSVDMIFTDLPYGTTQNTWDSQIDLVKMWREFERIIKDDGCIALFAQSPFDKVLACSNLKLYRYEWIIEKTQATGFLNANKMPMKAHENILIFYKKLPTYHPQKTTGHLPVHSYTKKSNDGSNYSETKLGISGGGSTERYPRDVLRFKWDTQTSKLHPTQKPVALCEYIIKTYTNEDDTILDCCMGSASIGKAALLCGRKYIGMELEEKYFNIAYEEMIRTTKILTEKETQLSIFDFIKSIESDGEMVL